MNALSLWQPWGTLVAHGEKKWETRPFPIRYRGPLVIAATLITPSREMQFRYTPPFASVLNRHGYEHRLLPVGCLLAMAEVTDCITTGEWVRKFCTAGSFHEHTQEYTFGDYRPGRFAIKLENVRILSEPLKVKGGQRIWHVPAALESEVLNRISP